MKRYAILVLILAVTIMTGCNKTTTDTTEEEITLGENQSLSYGQISEIVGNEITYTVAEEVSAEDMQNMGPGSQNTSENSEDTAGQNTQTAQAGTGSTGTNSGTPATDTNNTAAAQTSKSAQSGTAGNQFPAGQATASDGSGTPPQMPGDSGSMPTDQANGQNQDSSTESAESDRSTGTNKKTEDRVMYKLTDEVKTTMIPVGTAVVTKLGTTTTFSRLASGDTIKMLIEKDGDTETILKIWIVG